MYYCGASGSAATCLKGRTDTEITMKVNYAAFTDMLTFPTGSLSMAQLDDRKQHA